MYSPGAYQIVLVVDDERPIADLVAAILSMSGYEPHVAYSGEEALRLLDTIIPHLLISDVMMPGIGGVQLVMEFKKRCPECKVLLCSGAVSPQNALEQLHMQGYDFKFLEKPFHATELLRSIA